MVDLQKLFDTIFSKINGTHGGIAEKVLKGASETFDEYKLLCGKLHGLQQCTTHIVDTLKESGILVPNNPAPQAPNISTAATPVEGEVIAPQAEDGTPA